MFERYTEKARRTLFFARHEASQFGASYVETEHLLLGVLQQDQALARQLFGSDAKVEDVRRSIARRRKTGPKGATWVEAPLSRELKRALAFSAEESERMNDNLIGTPHLLLGLLRKEKSFAAQLLREQGLTVELGRARLRRSEPPLAQGRSTNLPGLDQWLAKRQAPGSMWTVKPRRAGKRTVYFALYAGGDPQRSETEQDLAPAAKLVLIQKRIDSIVGEMERATAHHERERVRFFLDEELKERENLRQLREQFELDAPPPGVPLCIEIVRDDLFSELRKRCDEHIDGGVAEVWLLEPASKRAYTATKAEGLREFRGGILQIANPPLEMDLRTIFD